MTANATSSVLGPALVLGAILLLHRLAWHGLPILIRAALGLPTWVTASHAWARSLPWRSRFAERHPRFDAVLRARLTPRAFTGLPLTLLIVGAAYAVALLVGLVEELREADELVRFDSAVETFLTPYRVASLIEVARWITVLGAAPALTAVAAVATGFLWADRRPGFILPLWFAFLGAEATTWIGKYAIGRVRPSFIEAVAANSPSFPSGHATGAMAVFGFLAYALARDLDRPRACFEVVFWTAVLIALIGFSRVFLGVHFLSDVASGFLVGGFWLLVGVALVEWRRWRPQAET